MPKRTHPEENPPSPQQLKTHVGEKEVNEGVNKEEKMKEVYDKTLNMMMEGAKKVAEQEKEAEMKEEEEEDKKDEQNTDILPGQTYLELSNDGQPKIAGVYEEASDVPNGKHNPTAAGESINGVEKIDSETETVLNGAGDAQTGHDTESVQKTTLADVGFNLDAVKSSPRPSPAKLETSPKQSPIKLVKKPLDLH